MSCWEERTAGGTPTAAMEMDGEGAVGIGKVGFSSWDSDR